MSETDHQADMIAGLFQHLDADFLLEAEAQMQATEKDAQEKAFAELDLRVENVHQEISRLGSQNSVQHYSWPTESGWFHVLLSPTTERDEPADTHEGGWYRYFQVTTNDEIRSETGILRQNKDYFVDFQEHTLVSYEGTVTMDGSSWQVADSCPPLIVRDDPEEGPGRYWMRGYDPSFPKALDGSSNIREIQQHSDLAIELLQLLQKIGPALLDSEKEFEK